MWLEFRRVLFRSRVTRKTSNSGPVVGGGERGIPTGVGGVIRFIGTRTAPPLYVPVVSGAPNKSWTLRISYSSPRPSTAERSAVTVSACAQLYTMTMARPASYGFGRTTIFDTAGGADSWAPYLVSSSRESSQH